MAKVLDMPKLSPTMEEGVLAIWHKREGDVIGVDDLLAEVETDKATMEFRSFDKGALLKVLVAPGATVKPGSDSSLVSCAAFSVGLPVSVTCATSENHPAGADSRLYAASATVS